MINLSVCKPRQSVLDGSEDFVVNLSSLPVLSEAEAREFLDANVLTSGMEDLIMQVTDRLKGGKSRGIFKLSEAMGGGKTQSMIASGLLARFPNLAKELPFAKQPEFTTPDAVISFTGRDTDKNVWTTIGEELGARFQEDSAPSENQWAEALADKSVLILLDELAFFLVHASTKGNLEEGARFSKRTAIALTNLFGAVRDHKTCRKAALVIADLQKDWDQGQEELARIMRSDATLGGTIQSADNEMSKGAVAISPVDNTKDELYAILKKRLFQSIGASDSEKEALIQAYFKELETAKKAGMVSQTLATIHEQMEAAYPFHYSTKHLIATFNDNPGFQKTRDVIRLMASIVRAIWEKGPQEVKRHHLLSLTSADLNDSRVAARFKEIKRSLGDALQTDISNNGTSFAESLGEETDGLSLDAAKWIYVSSLSEARPKGLKREEIAEYMTAPGVDVSGISVALDALAKSCWYLDQLKSGGYFFNKVKNLNAQINSHLKLCSDPDRDLIIEEKLKEMFEPKVKRCYQQLHIHPDFGKVSLNRDRTTMVICHHDAPFQDFFAKEKYKNRVCFLTLVDPAGLQRMRGHAKRLWAVRQVLKDMNREDPQYSKARDELTTIQTELFLSLRSLYARLWYPLGDLSTGDSKLESTTLLDSFKDDDSGNDVKFEGSSNSSKGEFVVETTLRSVSKFQVVLPASGTEKVKSYRSIRTRMEQFLFPSSGRANWEQLLDAAASRGIMVWVEPGTMARMKDTLLSAGEWREAAGQVMKPPFEEEATVTVEHERDAKTGRITTTDIKLLHGDRVKVSEDGGAFKQIAIDEAFVSDAMSLAFQAEDSTGKNKPGKPFRIENRISLEHSFMPSATSGHRLLKLGVVPTDALVKYTTDGSDPANLGKAFPVEGADVPEGSTVKVFSEKGAAHYEVSIPIPKASSGKDGGKEEVKLDLEKPVLMQGRVLKDLGLSSRLQVHGFLSSLPKGTEISGVRTKTVRAETDNRVGIMWDSKTALDVDRILKSYEFLDQELPDAEWELECTGQVKFPRGQEFLEWQKKTSNHIASERLSQ